jgi:hypothetical protein
MSAKPRSGEEDLVFSGDDRGEGGVVAAAELLVGDGGHVVAGAGEGRGADVDVLVEFELQDSRRTVKRLGGGWRRRPAACRVSP